MAGEFGVSVPWPTGYGPVVRRMGSIAERAVAAQAGADAAIRACGVVGVVSSDVAASLGEMLRVYSRLYFEAEALDTALNPTLTGIQRDLLELLSYHLHMVRDAGDLAFSGRDVPRNERFRLELGDGLGARAEELARLRERLVWDECG
ncbi:MAG TPA: hypothetical protein VFN97_09950 [Actinospica sp.]|nr:hypothetical protein [Actinospica sp.]